MTFLLRANEEPHLKTLLGPVSTCTSIICDVCALHTFRMMASPSSLGSCHSLSAFALFSGCQRSWGSGVDIPPPGIGLSGRHGYEWVDQTGQKEGEQRREERDNLVMIAAKPFVYRCVGRGAQRKEERGVFASHARVPVRSFIAGRVTSNDFSYSNKITPI